MAVSDTELFFELTNSVFVQSVESPNQIVSPTFIADDVKPILLKLVRRISPDSVEVVDLTGVTVQVAFGTPLAAPTVLTSGTSGTVDDDGFLPLSVLFNVTPVQTALGTYASIVVTMELRVVFGSSPQRFQVPVTIKQRLITGTLVDPDPPAVATSLDEVLSLCVPRDGSNTDHPCSSFIMPDEDDATMLYRVTVRAGQMHCEPLQ